jgi:hypothetical protein
LKKKENFQIYVSPTSILDRTPANYDERPPQSILLQIHRVTSDGNGGGTISLRSVESTEPVIFSFDSSTTEKEFIDNVLSVF